MYIRNYLKQVKVFGGKMMSRHRHECKESKQDHIQGGVDSREVASGEIGRTLRDHTSQVHDGDTYTVHVPDS